MTEPMLAPLLREMWVDIPRKPASGSLAAVLAALAGGEPRRALALLDAAGSSAGDAELASAFRYLAAQLDAGWFPGPVGTMFDFASQLVVPPKFVTIDPRRRLALDQAVVYTVQSLSFGAMATGAVRTSNGPAVLAAAQPMLDAYAKAAEQAGDAQARVHAALHLAAIAGRARVDDVAGQALDAAGELAARLGPAAQGSVELAKGDALFTPGSSPESLGLDLSLPAEPPRLGDARARRAASVHYRRARTLLARASSSRGVAAADLRLGALALVDGRPEDAARLALQAAASFRKSHDAAGWALARTHAVLAVMAAGSTATGRAEVLQPIVRWALARGSRSYAVGCARLICGMGAQWRRTGDLDAGLVALDLAADLAGPLDDPDGRWTAEVAQGDAYAALNSHGAAIAIYEENLDEILAPHGGLSGDGPLSLSVWMKAAQRLTLLFGQAIVERDPDGLTDVAARLAPLLARAPQGPIPVRPGPDLLIWQQTLEQQVAALAEAGAELTEDDAEWQRIVIELTAVGLIDDLHTASVGVELGRAVEAARRGQTATADAAFSRALAIADRSGPSGATLAITVLVNWGRWQEAQPRADAFLSAAPDIDPEFAARLWLNVHRPEAAATALGDGAIPPAESGWARDWLGATERGQIELAANDVGAARRFLDEGITRFERRFAQVPGDMFRVSLADDDDVRQLYQASAAAAVAAGDHGPAFAHADRTRLLSLAGLLDEQAAGRKSPALRAWREAQALLTGAFDRRRETWRHRGGPELAATGDALRAAKQRFRRAEAAVEAAVGAAIEGSAQAGNRTGAKAAVEVAFGTTGPAVRVPRRRRVPTRPPAPLATGAVQAALDDKTVLVSYLVGGDELLVFTLTRSTCQGQRLPVDSLGLVGLASRAHAACRGWPVEDLSPLPTLEADLGRLAEALLDPIHLELDGHRRVVVVPFSSFHLLPFHALPFGGGRLGDEKVVSHLPTALLVPSLAGRRAPRLDRGAVVVGDPATDPARRLPRLPGAAVEARAVGRALGVEPLIDTGATVKAVRSALPGRAIIHLATHGVLDEVAPTLSSLALAGKGELSVAQLLGLDLDADLVVLSACDSGRGDITRGGDVVGLARGVLAAGTRHAVVSLWPVDDQAACLTMTSFAKELADGAPVADALTAARNDLRTLSWRERQKRYDALAAAPRSAQGPAGTRPRDGRLPGVSRQSADHPTWWAPFIHIGL